MGFKQEEEKRGKKLLERLSRVCHLTSAVCEARMFWQAHKDRQECSNQPCLDAEAEVGV